MKRKIPSLDKRYAKHRPVSDEEAKLWTEAMEGKKETVRLKPALKKAAAPAAEKAKITAAPAKKPRIASETPLLDKATLARIRKGAQAIDGMLDLHGHTRESAYQMLVRFVMQAQARGWRTVLVITGKGGPEKAGVLRRLLPLWLNESPLREHIIAYDNAGLHHGGDGAWYVRIRKPA